MINSSTLTAHTSFYTIVLWTQREEGGNKNMLHSFNLLSKCDLNKFWWSVGCCQTFSFRLLLLWSNAPRPGSEQAPDSSWPQQHHQQQGRGRPAVPSQLEQRHTATPGGAQTEHADSLAASHFRVKTVGLLSVGTQPQLHNDSCYKTHS